MRENLTTWYWEFEVRDEDVCYRYLTQPVAGTEHGVWRAEAQAGGDRDQEEVEDGTEHVILNVGCTQG